ncbi:Kazal-type serine protease inhibitor domain protein [Cooperia oncophora]
MHLAVILLSLISSSFAQLFKPCGCEKTFKPVCGTDGITYDNLCALECKSQYGKHLSLIYYAVYYSFIPIFHLFL